MTSRDKHLEKISHAVHEGRRAAVTGDDAGLVKSLQNQVNAVKDAARDGVSREDILRASGA